MAHSNNDRRDVSTPAADGFFVWSGAICRLADGFRWCCAGHRRFSVEGRWPILVETLDRYRLLCGGHLLPAASIRGRRGLNTGISAFLFCSGSSGPDELFDKSKSRGIAVGIVQRIDLNYSGRNDLETLAVQFLMGLGAISGNWDADDWHDALDDGSCHSPPRRGS